MSTDTPLPIQTATDLLKPHAALLERLHLLSGCSATHFAAVYSPLLERFAEYVQQVPDASASPERTLLQARLQAAERALARRRGAILPLDAEPERVAREADLWTYVLFAAALLRELATAFAPWAITVTTANHQVLGRWQPQIAPRGFANMPHAAAYHARPSEETPGPDWTPLMIGALLPETAWNWLWREPPILAAWQQVMHRRFQPDLNPLLMP